MHLVAWTLRATSNRDKQPLHADAALTDAPPHLTLTHSALSQIAACEKIFFGKRLHSIFHSAQSKWNYPQLTKLRAHRTSRLPFKHKEGKNIRMRRHYSNLIEYNIAIIIAMTFSAMTSTSTTYGCLAFTAIQPSALTRPSSSLRQTWRTTPPSCFRPMQEQSTPLFHPTLVRPKMTTTSLRSSSSSNNQKSKPPPLPTSDDPYLLLGLDPRHPTVDAKEIKRAYRKRAMQYHPDVLLGSDSTEKERDVASKDFARINAAYELLTGGAKGGVGSGSGSAAGSAGARTSSGGYNYQPPHRRSSSSQSSYSSNYGNNKSTNWEDYMPNYNDEDAKYDADGDSFGAIFSDILTGAAGVAAGVASSSSGSGGIFGDFIDFLEGNVDGFASGYGAGGSSSADDDRLFAYGSFDEVAEEMDETDILVSSLETKLNNAENEIMQAQADLNLATKFSERLDLEERVEELRARQKVVKGYLKRGKKRLIRLRERYKELMVEGRGGRGYGGGRGTGGGGGSSYTSSGSAGAGYSGSARTGSSNSGSYSSSGGASSGSSSSGRSTRSTNPYSRETSTSTSASSSYSPPTSSSTPSSSPTTTDSSSSKSWRNEGFSSSYGRSSSSRRSSRRNRGGASNVDQEPQPTTSNGRSDRQQQQQQRQRGDENVSSESGGSNSYRSTNVNNNSGSNTSTGRTSSTSTPQPYEPWVPPHRRTQSSSERVAQEKKRLRELQVEDDFDRLKREMGM